MLQEHHMFQRQCQGMSRCYFMVKLDSLEGQECIQTMKETKQKGA